jgi:dienelactone hydrolase
LTKWQAKWLKERKQEYEQVIKNKTGQELYQALQAFSYKKPLILPGSFLSLRVAVNDSVDTRCYLRFPPGYDSQRAYPVLFFLHGAVHANRELPLLADSLSWQMAGETLTSLADSLGYILAIPFANKDYNWMEPDAGWPIVPHTVRLLRQLVNVDNNRLFLSGHSNGATGVFSYLLRQPSDFAGFYGFNTQPKIRTGGSFLINAQNRSFYAVAVEKDYYYPTPALDTLTLIAQKIGINFTTKTYRGFPHWFPYTKDFRQVLRCTP